jgi:phosphoglycerate dehydrogenase-like enzyme
MLGKVLITAKSVSGSKPALDYLLESGCAVDVKDTPTPFDERWLSAQVRDVDAAIFAMEPMTDAVLGAAPRLKIIARPGVGYDTVDMAAATRRRIAVTIAAGLNHQSVADFTMALLLAAARGIVPAAGAVQNGRWQRETGTEVWRKTLLLFGFGRIAQAVAQRARGFDMSILIVKRTPGTDPGSGMMQVTLAEGLERADFVSLHAPLTELTRGVINSSALALMKPSAYLINTARGGLVDEAALAEAVRSGRLAGAAVDVLEQQGDNSGSALIGVPGIIVTPHMATFAREAMGRVALSAAQSVVAALTGQRPAGIVNPEIYRSERD